MAETKLAPGQLSVELGRLARDQQEGRGLGDRLLGSSITPMVGGLTGGAVAGEMLRRSQPRAHLPWSGRIPHTSRKGAWLGASIAAAAALPRLRAEKRALERADAAAELSLPRETADKVHQYTKGLMRSEVADAVASTTGAASAAVHHSRGGNRAISAAMLGAGLAPMLYRYGLRKKDRQGAGVGAEELPGLVGSSGAQAMVEPTAKLPWYASRTKGGVVRAQTSDVEKTAATRWATLVRAGQLSKRSLGELKQMGLHGTEEATTRYLNGLNRGSDAILKKNDIPRLATVTDVMRSKTAFGRKSPDLKGPNPWGVEVDVPHANPAESTALQARHAVVLRHEVDEARAAIKGLKRQERAMLKKHPLVTEYSPREVSDEFYDRMPAHSFAGARPFERNYANHLHPRVLLNESAHQNMLGIPRVAGRKVEEGKLNHLLGRGKWWQRDRPFEQMWGDRHKIERAFDRRVRQKDRKMDAGQTLPTIGAKVRTARATEESIRKKIHIAGMVASGATVAATTGAVLYVDHRARQPHNNG